MNAKIISVTCPWCKTYYQTRTEINCKNCGGILPPAAGPERGEAPASSPRFVPKQFKNKLLFEKNYFLIFGVLFTFSNLPLGSRINGLNIFFIGLGIFVCWWGINKARKRISVLEKGIATHGTIINVRKNTGTKVNGKSPIRIEYTYVVDGTVRESSIDCWDESASEHYADEPVWVVYLNENFANNSSIWPPFA